ncbi:MAG: LmeA family phospholipid-binding protein [Anaerolineae bacterium]|nr:LmeA family phospholipid-binding protein [Anaerolineae bacterium]
MKRLTLLCLLLLTLLAACNRENLGVQQGAEGGLDLTLSLSEADVNTALTAALAQLPNPLLRSPQADLQSGQILVTGQHERRDGQGTVSGTVTLTVTVQDGALLVQATQISIEGFDAGDARLAGFNRLLQDAFNNRLSRDRGLLTFKSVTITDAALEVVANVQRP